MHTCKLKDKSKNINHIKQCHHVLLPEQMLQCWNRCKAKTQTHSCESRESSLVCSVRHPSMYTCITLYPIHLLQLHAMHSAQCLHTCTHGKNIQKKEVNYYISRCSNPLKIEMHVLFRHTRARKSMPSWKCMCPKSIKIVLFYICYYEYLNNLAHMSTKHLYETCNITAPN